MRKTEGAEDQAPIYSASNAAGSIEVQDGPGYNRVSLEIASLLRISLETADGDDRPGAEAKVLVLAYIVACGLEVER